MPAVFQKGCPSAIQPHLSPTHQHGGPQTVLQLPRVCLPYQAECAEELPRHASKLCLFVRPVLEGVCRRLAGLPPSGLRVVASPKADE
jgi:hypothetical protein